MDQDGDRIAETVIPAEAFTKSVLSLRCSVISRALDWRGYVVHLSLDPDFLCNQLT